MKIIKKKTVVIKKIFQYNSHEYSVVNFFSPFYYQLFGINIAKIQGFARPFAAPIRRTVCIFFKALNIIYFHNNNNNKRQGYNCTSVKSELKFESINFRLSFHFADSTVSNTRFIPSNRTTGFMSNFSS